MGISRMNHAVLYVRDARRQQRFYADVLGFATVVEDPDGGFVFMRGPDSPNHHDIAFFTIGADAQPSDAGSRTVGMYHIAWEVGSLEQLAEMRDRLAAAGALIGASDHGANKSLYAKDPDGLEFEVMWLVPAGLWGDEEHEAIIRPLDIEAEQRAYAGRLP
jgi:catechol-2,3-dioxygenase